MPQFRTLPAFLAMRDQGLPLLDVRSPGEFAFAHIPGALNLPLFTDEERAKVGTAHARSGREGAVHLALELVGGHLAALLAAPAICAAASARSCSTAGGAACAATACAGCWKRAASPCTGWKAATKATGPSCAASWRAPGPILVLGGYTGCGKTDILLELQRLGSQVIDLEGLATTRALPSALWDRPKTSPATNGSRTSSMKHGGAAILPGLSGSRTKAATSAM